MSAGFDEICRVIASPVSRRTAIRTVVGIAAGGLFAFSPRRVLAAGPCQQFDKAEGCPGLNVCGEDPRRDGGILCCPAGTTCCYNFERDRCECCAAAEVCCKDENGRNSGTCCHNADGCCANDAGLVQACCGEEQVCCLNARLFTHSGICCHHQNGCCTDTATNMVRACCHNDTQRCCDSGFCCDRARTCCGDFCCPVGKPDCCDFRVGFCCAEEEGCCPGAIPANDRCCPAGTECCLGAIPKCCRPGQTCCQDAALVLADCCDPGDPCLNGVCGRSIASLAYTGRGSAKAVLADGSVSIIRFEIAGTGVPIPPDSFGDTDNISGSLQAFNYATRALIDSVRYSGVQGRRSADGDVFIVATGSARANGRPINIVLMATNADGVIAFDIRNRETGAFLAGGTGETGRADLRLTVTA